MACSGHEYVSTGAVASVAVEYVAETAELS